MSKLKQYPLPHSEVFTDRLVTFIPNYIGQCWFPDCHPLSARQFDVKRIIVCI